MSKDNGGPAFPREDYQANGHDRGFEKLGQEGMTLRDYFAAKAMQGWLASYGPSDKHPALNDSSDALAVISYQIADAMLEARNK